MALSIGQPAEKYERPLACSAATKKTKEEGSLRL
jgi:hypothetical protein